jgi:uncharacterized protein (DUF4415 family)
MSKAYENKKPSHLVKLSSTKFAKTRQLKSNLARVRNLSDEDIAADVAKDSDVAPLLAQWPKDAHVVIPRGKIPISLRVDADIVEFFKSYGGGYLSRMNAVLRAYMKSMHKKKMV